MASPGSEMRHLEVTPPPCDEHRCLRHPRGQHRCGLIVVAGAVRAKEINGKRDGVFVDAKDKGEDTRERRLGEPAGVSRVNTHGTPQEWSQTSSHDVPWPHVSASHGLENVATIGRHNSNPGGRRSRDRAGWPFTGGNNAAHSFEKHRWQRRGKVSRHQRTQVEECACQ